jgi:hypothetical protein
MPSASPRALPPRLTGAAKVAATGQARQKVQRKFREGLSLCPAGQGGERRQNLKIRESLPLCPAGQGKNHIIYSRLAARFARLAAAVARLAAAVPKGL